MRPLQGLRVLDFTMYQQGPQATLMMADMGAEVIKVEPPGSGEPTRAFFRTGPHKVSVFFLAMNRGKKSITVNLKSLQGREIIYRLAARCDVAVHNFRSGVMERLGLGYEELKRHNPRLVYAFGSGWGTRGPRAAEPSYDLAAQAMGGIMSVTGEEGGYPLPAGAAIADHVGAMNLLAGVLAALWMRERTGQGCQVDVSLLGGQLNMQAWEMTWHLITQRPTCRAGRGHPLVTSPWRVFATADGHIVVGGVWDERWGGLCRALGRPELENDPRFADNRARWQNLNDLYAIIDPIFPTRTTQEWMDALRAEDIIHAPVCDYAAISRDPQVLENGYIVTVDHPYLGPVPVVGCPIHFDLESPDIAPAAPELGQHTEELLRELGYTADEMAALRAAQVI